MANDLRGWGSALKFQSSPDPKAGRNDSGINEERQRLNVPILTRPEGRAQRHERRRDLQWPRFQSSPDPKAGRNVVTAIEPHAEPQFQSSPDPKAGRNVFASVGLAATYAFQSSPDPKAGRNGVRGQAQLRYCPVPILARPEGRAQRLPARAIETTKTSSNPRPTRRPGATNARSRPSGSGRCSNPRPTRRPGATNW